MLIGQVCKRAGVSKDCIRHYETLGLIRSVERPAGSRTYREYGDDTIHRLELIAKGKSMGYSLREMQPWLDVFIEDRVSKADHVELVSKKLAEVNERLRVLRKIKRDLTEKLCALNEEIGLPRIQ